MLLVTLRKAPGPREPASDTSRGPEFVSRIMPRNVRHRSLGTRRHVRPQKDARSVKRRIRYVPPLPCAKDRFTPSALLC